MKIGRKIQMSMLGIFIIVFLTSIVIVSSQSADYCCERTTYGAWCQNAPQEQCNENYRMAPTSCDATSYCKQGCCYDSSEGLCMENTPQKVCDDKEGTWVGSPDCDIAQCELGCCVLDTQAAFVTLTRCKRLGGFFGIETDFRLNIGSEVECIAVTQAQDRGACVYEEEFTRTCKFTTRELCENIESTGNMTEPEFYKDYLCSAEELGTECGPSTETGCVEGKDEVYFKDSCGNPANIYDASKVNDKVYWQKILDRSESCGFGNSNAGSKTCGNCDYYLGSYCKEAKRGESPTYGDYICEDLNCYGTSDGKDHRHGESWCSYDGNVGEGRDAVGSLHVRHICVNGEELIEACDFKREEVCLESETDTGSGVFIEAACVVNRWKDCVEQDEEDDCENTDRRDCYWREGLSFVQEIESNSDEEGAVGGVTYGGEGLCLPNVPPGFSFWKKGASEGQCNVGSAQCVVTYEEGLFDDEDCVDNCYCLTEEWAQGINEVCSSLGDCGGYVNYLGSYTSDGYEWTEDESKKSLGKSIVDSIKRRAGV